MKEMQSLKLCETCNTLNHFLNEKCTNCSKNEFRKITIDEYLKKSFKKLNRKILKGIFDSECDYCNGYDVDWGKCRYYACCNIEKDKAKKRMET